MSIKDRNTPEELTEEEIIKGLRAETLAMNCVPVLAGSALKDKGVRFVLDAALDFLPAPAELGDEARVAFLLPHHITARAGTRACRPRRTPRRAAACRCAARLGSYLE